MTKKILLTAILILIHQSAFTNTNACRITADPLNIYLGTSDENKADGSSKDDAALYTRSGIWKKVNESIQKGPVTVHLKNGVYSSNKKLELSCIGNEKHTLTIKGQTPDGVIFNSSIPELIVLKGCQNIIIENLNFTGPATGYGLRITSKKLSPSKGKNAKSLQQNRINSTMISKNILIRNCNWYDMEKLYYGALGAHRGSHHVTVEDCTFKNMGLNSHFHMMYNAYDADYITLRNCYFQDAAGAYVRFRDACDYGMVTGCTFVSTGKYVNYDPKIEVFIEIPVFIDVDPGDENFGNTFTFTDNKFIFTPAEDGMRCGIRFRHSGFDPVGWNYILTAQEGAVLEAESIVPKIKLLKKNFGIDLNRVTVNGNKWQNVNRKMLFTSWTGFGSKSKGWHKGKEKRIDITDLMLHCNRPESVSKSSSSETNFEAKLSQKYEVEVKKDVSYLPSCREEKCDLYLPKNLPENMNVPAVILIHGGGWKGGQKDGKREIHLGTTLAQNGYVAMSIDYLLTKNNPSWPQNLYDCKSAVRYLRKNASSLQIDKENIGVMGGSAGGHLSAMLAVTGDDPRLTPPDADISISSKVQAAVDLYGITDVPAWPRSYTAEVLGATLKENRKLWEFASPINHITQDDPPFLILHGLNDNSVSYQQSVDFFKALSAKSVQSRLILVSGAPHTFPLYSEKYSDLVPVIIDFFDRNLKNKIKITKTMRQSF